MRRTRGKPACGWRFLRRGLLFSLGLLLLSPFSWCRAQEIGPPPHPVLSSLRIQGAKVVSARSVRQQLRHTLPSPLPWKKKPPFRKEALEADLEQLRLYYRSQGFYHAQVTAEVSRKEQQVQVTIRVEEGPYVKVTRIAVVGLDPIPEAERVALRRNGPLQVGQRFTDPAYEELKRHYLEYLQNHGYYKATLTGVVYVDDELNTAEIVLTVNPGPLCVFGEVTVEGARHTPVYLIERKLAFRQGELFSLAKVLDSQKNLYDTDLFQRVAVTPREVAPEETVIPVQVSVTEKKPRTLKVGLGYGDEDLFRARVGLRIRNVAGGGRLLDLEARHSSLETRLLGNFVSPQMLTSSLDLVAAAGWLRRELPGFTDQSYYTQLRLERPLPWKFRGYLGHAFEYARPFDVPLAILLLLKDTAPGRIYRSSMLIYGLSRDTIINPSDPRGGGKISLAGECALGALGSNLEFYRQVLEVRRYHTLLKEVVLFARLKFGLIQPLQETREIPIQRRFFSGGYSSVRGYRLDYLGPRTPGGDPLGGEAVMEGNLQAQVPVYKKLRAVGFWDFGNVFLKAADFDPGRLKYAAGFGLNYLTPIGPVGLYFAWPLNPIDPQADTFRIHFTIGPPF